MSADASTAVRQGVTLLRLGVGVQEIDLPEGATLADLLRKAGVGANGHEIMIDGRPLIEAVELKPGMIVSISAKPRHEPDPPWVATFGMFRDDPGFEDFTKRVQARRDSETEGS